MGWIVSPSEKYVEVLTPNASKYNLICKQGLCKFNQDKFARVGLTPVWRCPCKKREIKTQTQTHRENTMLTIEVKQMDTCTSYKHKHWWEEAEAGRGREESSPRGFRGGMATSISWFTSSGLQSWERIHFTFFKPPNW